MERRATVSNKKGVVEPGLGYEDSSEGRLISTLMVGKKLF